MQNPQLNQQNENCKKVASTSISALPSASSASASASAGSASASGSIRSLNSLSAADLVQSTLRAVQNERKSTAEVVRHFQEISDRKLYLEHGYPSMFEMVTKEFGYCAGSAQRRINSMRLVKELPEVEAKLESGELSLTVAATVQSFFYAHKKEKQPYSIEAKRELIDRCLGKSTRDVEKELATRNPEMMKKETKRAVSEDRIHVSFTISSELNSKLEKIKSLLSHIDPNMSLEKLVEKMAEIALEKLETQKRSSSSKNKSTIQTDSLTANSCYPEARGEFRIENSKTSSDSLPAREIESKTGHNQPLHGSEKRSRYISAKVKREVWQKNLSQGCEFVSHVTNRKCGSKNQLQIDHVKAFALGGGNTLNNLRILCAQHNRWRWENETGRTK